MESKDKMIQELKVKLKSKNIKPNSENISPPKPKGMGIRNGRII